MSQSQSARTSRSKRPTQGLSIEAHFVPDKQDPYLQCEWIRCTSRIENRSGGVVAELHDVEAPAGWSQLAIDIMVSQYFRRAGLPKRSSATGGETSVRQVISRVVETITVAGLQQGYFASGKDARQFAKELAHILLQQKGAFNSPVWFNCGLFHKYGIHGSAHLWAWSETKKKAVATKSAYERPQCSACFIQDLNDDLASIFDLAKSEALIFKFGSGTGTNFSKLRGKGEPLESGGQSSGLISFLEVLDRGAGATKSGGTSRRAAKMVCLDVDHPEIRDFIAWKAKEEKKAKALIAAGFSGGLEGEAFHTVSGQNSNNSVRLSDAFMQALEMHEGWSTYRRTDGQENERIKARELWRELAQAAWECADPGVQYHDTINAWHTCAHSGPIRASNPCSEYMFLDNTACNLASLNLGRFLKDDGEFDLNSFRHAIRVLLIAQDILVDFSAYPTKEISEKSHKFRPLGLGFANLGGLLMRLGLAYDSELALSWASGLSAVMTGQAYLTSSELARELGPFAGYTKNKNPMSAVLERHQKSLEQLPSELVFLAEAKEIWRQVLNNQKEHGMRNSQVTAIAPTGTIGLVMDCETTGIEPEFSLVRYKKLASGGQLKIVNQAVSAALFRQKYTKPQVEAILRYIDQHSTIEGAPDLRLEDLAVFDCANRGGPNGQRVIEPMAHLRMLAAVQPFVSGAISKTVNLPSTATVEDVEEIYWQGWRMGLKSIALYRDGSKFVQPLTASDPLDVFLEQSKVESPSCSVCGHKTIRSGTCFKCLNCGHSDSC